MPTPSLQKQNKHLKEFTSQRAVLIHLLLVTDHNQPHLGVHLVHQQLVLNEQQVKYSQELHKVHFNNH